MPELSRMERLAAAREEFKDAVMSTGDAVPTGRFVLLKSKSSQAGLTVTNSVTVKDQSRDVKFIVSVNCTVSGESASADMLESLQASVTKFLSSIQKEID